MHLQIRTKPAASPADLQAFLTVLAEANVNILAAGGGDVEAGGEFAIAVAHGEEEATMAILRKKGYKPRKVEVEHAWLTNEPGQLLGCVAGVTQKNGKLGRHIRDVSLGAPDADGRIPVQVYSERPGS